MVDNSKYEKDTSLFVDYDKFEYYGDVKEYQYNNGEYDPIKLLSFQIPHIHRLVRISKFSKHIFDSSDMGLGKTICAVNLALVLGLPAFIVAPKTCIPWWRKNCELFGLKTYQFITYSSLAGSKAYELKNGWLTRDDTVKGKKNHVKYTPTKNLLTIVNEGCIFIFDESQEFRNKTCKFKAIKTICKLVNDKNTTSRILYPSGTLYAKPECSINYARCCGVINSSKMYNTSRGKFTTKGYGLQEIIDNCKAMDEYTTNAIMDMFGKKTKDDIDKMCHKLFTDVIFHYLHSSMEKPDYGYYVNVNNLYLKLDEPRTEIIKRKLIEMNNLINQGNFGGGINLAKMNEGLVDLDNVKATETIENALSILKSTKLDKVIIVTNFDTTYQLFKEAFKDYNGVCINGKVSDERKRMQLLDKFNNDDECRYLIVNRKVICFGTNPHDVIGGRKRHLFIFPSWFVLDHVQVINRLNRVGVKSDSEVFIIYALFDEENNLESLINEKIIVNTKNLYDIIKHDKSRLVQLPEKYVKMFIDKSLDEFHY